MQGGCEMSNIEQVQQVSNSPILWLLCGVTVVISAIQTVLLHEAVQQDYQGGRSGSEDSQGSFPRGTDIRYRSCFGCVYRNGWTYGFHRRPHGMAPSFHHRRCCHRAFSSQYWCRSMWSYSGHRAVYSDLSCGFMVLPWP